MSNAREKILGRVNAALAPLKERSPLPEWTPELIERRDLARSAPTQAGVVGEAGSSSQTDLWALFAERMRALHGLPMESEAELPKWLSENGWTHGYCDPELWPRMKVWLPEPAFKVSMVFDRASYDDYQFGITFASGAIAETGTLVLTDRDTPSRLGALAPWVHIAVIRRELIVPDIASALATMPPDPNVIWVSGPSKTADVEGILIEGVHGPGQQVALLI
jgi:L-lactate dehydrogenase complex protein LldG